MTDAGLISWDRVADLRSEIGEDDFAEVVALFLSEVEETLTRLSLPLPAPALADEFHALRGCALNLGMSALAEHCSQAEGQAQSGSSPPDIAAIRDVFARSRDHLHSRRARLVA